MELSGVSQVVFTGNGVKQKKFLARCKRSCTLDGSEKKRFLNPADLAMTRSSHSGWLFRFQNFNVGTWQ
ncbi:hypothetical protein FRX31_010361 [Thalictrum thalictroides]|uniref:Uncharacterized protein n=1 Tax=Thalictrum thalictroides TaxID=46969 RepID=A0A7J6WVE2_THATH|nr:hypothetical protein FRX31_010361 [Thalictrum thalictroides]